MTTRLACSPLTGQVLYGRLNKSLDAFTSEPKDMTNDFLRAVVEKAEFHEGGFRITSGEGEIWDVVVTKLSDEKKESK